jgi:hypothetical protein
MNFQLPGVKSLLLVCIVLLGHLTVRAQQSHFIYIQSDNKQPFSVVLNKKSYSSGGTGYLIISKIPAGKQTLLLGFTGSKLPAFEFAVVVDADAGYALKNYEEKGWGLYNLQSMAVVMGTASAQALPQQQQPVKPPAQTTAAALKPVANNQFGDMLSQVVDDPDLAKKTTPQPVEKPAVKTPASTAATQPTATKPVQKATVDTVVIPDAEDVAASAGTRGVIKAQENQDEKGTGMVIIDFNSKGSDTVKIFIPVTPPPADSVKVAEAKPEEKKDTPVTLPAQADTVVVPKEATAVNNPFYSKPAETVAAGTQEKREPAVTADSAVVELPEKKIASYNSNCTGGMASDKDLDKLKKRMVGEGADDKMIAAAKKAFKAKCYTTAQIKELGMLFFTDDSRYAFYDASYPFVYDVANFSSLEAMLLEDYYKKRFRAMLRS